MSKINLISNSNVGKARQAARQFYSQWHYNFNDSLFKTADRNTLERTPGMGLVVKNILAFLKTAIQTVKKVRATKETEKMASKVLSQLKSGTFKQVG